MSDTPRTDKVVKNGVIAQWSNTPMDMVEADFARELERENAKLKEECMESRKVLLMCLELPSSQWPTFEQERREVESEVRKILRKPFKMDNRSPE